jgi:hypothetical protein
MLWDSSFFDAENRKRILKIFSKNCVDYFIKGIVIMVSILGAYKLDNWTIERK